MQRDFLELSRTFGIWNEFKEHLHTGYPELHFSIINCIEYETKSIESAMQLYEKIKQRIRQEFGTRVRFQSIIDQEGHPTFDDERLIWDLIDIIDINNWEAFTADSVSGKRDIISQDKRYHVYNVDKTFVDNMAIRLTNAVSTSNIREDICNYRDIKKTREENCNKAMQQLQKLMNSLVLGEVLVGACNICIKYHDEEDIPRLQPLLSQPH